MRGKSSGKENERDDDQPDQRANEKAEDEGKTVLFAAEVLDQPYNTFWKSGKSGATHCKNLSEDGVVRRWTTNVCGVEKHPTPTGQSSSVVKNSCV